MPNVPTLFRPRHVKPSALDRLVDWVERWSGESTPALLDWCMFVGCDTGPGRTVLMAAQAQGLIRSLRDGQRGPEIRLTPKGRARARRVAVAQAKFRSRQLSAV